MLDKSNYAIGIACEKGYLAMVRLLMTDKRVDPSVSIYMEMYI
jgi:hypothetical protein